MNKKLLPLAFSLLLAAHAAQAADLSIEVSVPAAKQGNVLVAVFDKAEGFPRGRPVETAMAQPVAGKAVVRFTGLPAGDYAVSAFLDENGNTKLDANVFGLPSEPFGFSRNARAVAGPPTFAEAAFRVDGSAQQQALDLK